MRIAVSRHFVLFILTLGVPFTSFAQLSASLDEDFFFVLNGTGQQLAGLEIRSPAGGLVPVPGGQEQPFTFLLSNTSEQITYGNLGTSTEIDGSVRLSAQFDPQVNDVDTSVTAGIGNTPVEIPFNIGPCESCPAPAVIATINSDFQIQLSGVGQELSELTFRSPAGTLLPATSSLPFAQASVNLPTEIKLDSPGSKVALDGNVVLGIGWDPQFYTRDVSYEYLLVEETETTAIGPFELANKDYDFSLPQFPLVDVSVNDDDYLVLRGEGQPITSFTLTSSTGSLIPSNEVGPFDAYASNTADLIEFQLNEPLVIDGETVLPTKWDWRKPPRIQINYDMQGELVSRGTTILSSKFPPVPESGKEPLLITLDANNNFVLTGIGQEINGIQFTSPSGNLRTSSSEAPAPFPISLDNTPEQITLGVLGTVLMDGSFVMDFGPEDPALLDEIEISVGFAGRPVSNPANVDCQRCDFPSVVLTEDRGFVLENFPQPVTELTFSSEFGGLQEVDSLPNGLTLISSSTNQLVIGNEAGFDAGDLLGLEAVWGASSDGQVFVSFEFLDGASFGPLPLDFGSPLTTNPVVPEPDMGFCAIFAALGLLSLRRQR